MDEPGEDETTSTNNDADRREDSNADADNSVDRGENANADADDADDRGEHSNAADGDASGAHAQGPGENLPEQVPDHVRKNHATINQYLNGDIGNLGKAITDVV